MERCIRKFFSAVFAALFLASLTGLAPARANELQMVFIHVDSGAEVRKLAAMGLDIAAVRALSKDRLRVEAVVSSAEQAALTAKGFTLEAAKRGIAARALARTVTRSQFGFSVYTSFDEPDVGIRDRIYAVAANYPEIAELEVFGHSIQGRELLAIRLGAKRWHRDDDDDDEFEGDDDDDDRWNRMSSRRNKPEVLIVATHHAREWVAAQMGIRLLEYLASGYGADPRVTALLDDVDVWLVPLANPDGYEYTFTNERLWRKNLRDNDGDGQITSNDGVDLNRNFGSRWGYDDEGSSPALSNATYRGPAPFSEVENEAMRRFVKRHRFEYAISYHTYGNLMLYPWGWQVKTTSYDDGIFTAQAGVDGDAAIFDSLLNEFYDPGVSADLYITNGEFTDWLYGDQRIPSYTIELTSGVDAFGNFYGFEFADDEAQVQTVFDDNLEFALSLAESARDPANPVSPVDMPARAAYHEPLSTSHGRTQPVTVIARKDARKPKLYYSVDGGAERRAAFRPKHGRLYNEGAGVHYDRYQAKIRGQREGSVVTYRIVAGDTVLGPYSYTVENLADNSVLIMSAEDYTGGNPPYPDNSAPNYLHYYTASLDALGVDYHVWDVDQTMAAPPVDAVLAHYDKVIWYSGDDFAPEAVPGFRGLIDHTVNLREYFNYYSGKLFATGQDLSWLATQFGFIPGTSDVISDDFFQYYLGAFLDVDAGGADESSVPFDIVGEQGDPIFDGLSFGIQGGDGANNQLFPSSFLLTNHFLPQFPGVLSARYDRPGSPFAPFSGDFYVYSNQADVSYKRLGGQFTLPPGNSMLSFRTSFDIESDWDFLFVEISVVGSNAWTTLPDSGGLTSTATGQSCTSGWVDQLHPHLANYMDAACDPFGTTGEWNAMTGNSSGWNEVLVDLSSYAGQTVELYITYASDWATQGLGVFIDDIKLADEPLQDFETGQGNWTASPAPDGSAPALNNWERIPGSGFSEGPAIRTDNSVFLGFGFEAVDIQDNRNLLMQRVLEYLDAGSKVTDSDDDDDGDDDDD